MPKMLTYAGVGSRKTPPDVLIQMQDIAKQLSPDWLLRSGHAQGADQAFERGVIRGNGAMEIYVPWHGFNNAPVNHSDYIRPKATHNLANYAAHFHPNWKDCSDAAKLMHMRNVCQVLGEHGTLPADMLVCWTPGGLGSGGTGQAIRIAEDNNIPVFDLGLPGKETRLQLVKYVEWLDDNA